MVAATERTNIESPHEEGKHLPTGKESQKLTEGGDGDQRKGGATADNDHADNVGVGDQDKSVGLFGSSSADVAVGDTPLLVATRFGHLQLVQCVDPCFSYS